MYINIWWRHSIAESTGQIPHVPTKIPRAKVATVYLGSSVCVYAYVHACIFIVFFFFLPFKRFSPCDCQHVSTPSVS